MTDTVPAADPPPCTNETTHPDPKPVQLRFPTIDMNTSLESLLNHSTPTISEASTIMTTNTPPKPTMDESWASLDVSDFSHDDDNDDDDTHSVNSDAGSLVDLSSIHDTESAAEDDSQSEMGAGEERVAGMLRRGLSRQAEQVGQPDQQEVSPYEAMEDTIIFQQVPGEDDPRWIDMEYTRDVPGSADCKAVREVISMTISEDNTTLGDMFGDGPFGVYYHGPQNHTRDELLGKIGAALLPSSSNSNSRTSTGSTCFNIVPTEFGPGSKPAFADLIPSQAQMIVDEISTVNPSDESDSILFTSTATGNDTIESGLAKSLTEDVGRDFQCDLLVIHLTKADVDDHFSQFYSLIRLADRHNWATIIVAQDLFVTPIDSHRIPKRYGIQIDSKTDPAGNVPQSRRPIDLDTFMAVDTAQLGRHITYLHCTSDIPYLRIFEERNAKIAAQQTGSIMGRIRHSFFGKGKAKKRYVLRKYRGKSESLSSSLPKTPLSEQVQQVWSTMNVGQHLKDVAFTLIVMVLGIYIVGFSQNLTSKGRDLMGFDNTTMVSSKIEVPATVTAIPAITTSTTTATTATATVDQEVALYDPILFDQMWHRLTGRPTAAQEAEKVSQDVKEEEEVVNEPADVAKESEIVNDMVDRLAGWFQGKLDKVQSRVARPRVRNALKSLKIADKQIEVRELHQKLQDFYRDVTANVPKLDVAKHGFFQDLVARSHHHLRQTRWAGERKLERLIAEQKTLLSHAQHQAKHIVAAKKNRRSIFGRGRH